MGYELVGEVWDRKSFREYVGGLPPSALEWCKGVCVHHTAAPSLAQRPEGWKIQHMRNLESYYKGTLGWSAGPHLFTDEDQAFGMSSLYRRGVHAVSFNASHIGIETLGDYDNEDPKAGRGLDCWSMTAFVVSVLLGKMGITPTDLTVKFHRDDPRTSKTCPGKKVTKDWFLDLVKGQTDRADPIPVPEPPVEPPVSDALRADLATLCRTHQIKP